MDLALTKISSKGQVVIPADMRKGLKEGEKLLIIKKDKQFIIKKVSDLGEQFVEDLKFAQRVEKAWQDYDKGNSRNMKYDDFIKEMKKW